MPKEYSYGICPYMIINGYFFILVNKTSRTSYYNFFKGKQEGSETKAETAIREFKEETGITVKEEDLGKYFFQSNPRKDIGIFLVHFKDYYHSPFKFQKQEVFSALWINASKPAEMSKNQKGIFSDIMSYFEPELEKLQNYLGIE
jgi:8-oxo-dGTP pyrophosphatase MutT (NUDIX family)